MIKRYKTRQSGHIELQFNGLNELKLMIIQKKKFFSTQNRFIEPDEIVGASVYKSPYDLPIFERTLRVDLKNGEHFKLKRMKKAHAQEIARFIHNQILKTHA